MVFYWTAIKTMILSATTAKIKQTKMEDYLLQYNYFIRVFFYHIKKKKILPQYSKGDYS